MLAETGAALHLAANERLFETGDPGGTLYVVESGAVEIYLKNTARSENTVENGGKGRFFR